MNDFMETPLAKHLECITDPRRHNVRHEVGDIIMIALCAVVSGADSWTQVAEYGRSKKQWFKEFLPLPNGIPSHDTFGRLFARLDPHIFQDFFSRWIQDISDSIKNKTVAIDGKTLRGSHDKINGKTAIHMLSAWFTEAGLVLGQIKTKDKSNEITAIPELIKSLNLQGAVVTIDAMGCQKKITSAIVDQKADYTIQVKGNQKNLYQDIALFFQEPANEPFDYFETIDGDHGRIETRKYFTTDQTDWIEAKEQWAGLKTIAMATRQRDVNGVTSKESSYFISSLENDAANIAASIRDHWGIENGLHWCLDVSFREDLCRVRTDYAPENFATLRHIAINMLKQEKTLKGGLQTKRLKAAWDHKYLLKILNG